MKNEIKKHISLSLRDSIDTEENITYLCMHRLWISRRWRIKSSRLWWGRKASCLARGEKAAPCQRTFKRGFKSTGQAQIKTPPHAPNIHPKTLRTPTPFSAIHRESHHFGFLHDLRKGKWSPWFSVASRVACVWVHMGAGRRRSRWTVEECIHTGLGCCCCCLLI